LHDVVGAPCDWRLWRGPVLCGPRQDQRRRPDLRATRSALRAAPTDPAPRQDDVMRPRAQNQAAWSGPTDPRPASRGIRLTREAASPRSSPTT
jgi:hypothetical protein